MKMKEKDTFLFRGSKRALYFMTLIALLAVGVGVYLTVPSLNSAGTVSAQQQEANLPVGLRSKGSLATAQMISEALSSRTNNLSDTISALNQLPCNEVTETDLSGKSFGPGVYCLSSAKLAGEMVLNGANDPNSIFIFNVAGELETMENSRISLADGAKSYNVFFVANSANVGMNSDFRAAILAKNTINLNNARVAGRIASLTEQISGANNAPDGIGTGTLEICKAITGSTVGDLRNRVFSFTVTGANITTPITRTVRAGFCTAPFSVPNGPAVVTESPTSTNLAGGSPVTGNFALTNVRVIQAATPSPSTLGAVNLATRTAAVTIAESNINDQLTLEFTNTPAVTGFVEICKRANDVDVTGTFQFTVEGVFTATSTQNNRVLQIFTAPVGQCTAPIQVVAPFATTPDEAVVRVTELGRGDAFLQSANTIPADRQAGPVVFGSRVNAAGNVVADNAGGGFIPVRVLQGGVALQTIVEFFNRSQPGLLKVCKIAGPGIPANTLFSFTVTGTGPTTATGPVGAISRTFNVAAGPAAEGGSCTIVPGFGAGAGNAEFQTFVIGSAITVVENGPTTINGLPVRVSMRRSTSAATSPNEFTVVTTARQEVVEVEFTNFLFNPTILKICKVAGPGIAEGTPFTFTTTLVSPVGATGPLFPDFTATTTVNAGPAAQGGNCNIVSGAGLIGGQFNQGQTVTIAENAQAGTTVTSITSPTSTLPAFVPGTRQTTLTGVNGLVAGVSEVIFTNSGTVTPTPSPSPSVTPTPGPSPTPSPSPTPGGTRTITGTGTGAIPDNSTTGLTISFPVSGVTGTINNLSLSVTLTHTWVGDVDMTLRSPNGTTHSIVNRIGRTGGAGFGDSSNFGGTYVFSDTATGNIWDVATAATCGTDCVVAPGSYRTTGANSGTPTSLIAAFAGLTPAQANGTWTLIVRDLEAGDTGSVTAASLTIGPATGARGVKYDFDGDSKSDISVFRPSNGTWYVDRSGAGFVSMQFGQAGDIIAPADFDGDNRTDYAVYRNGTWHIQRSELGYTNIQFGEATDIPMPADFDGDGKADVAVFRPSNGTWYLLRSRDGFTGIQFGQTGDRPVAADYDNDGKADVAVYRNGTWYIQRSGLGFTAISFGQAGDRPVPADFDGDGYSDVAVYRPSNGTWYIMGSTEGFRGVAFGISTDEPSAADFDGDGRTDIAVFRPSNGTWYGLETRDGGSMTKQFGSNNDKSVPNAFIR